MTEPPTNVVSPNVNNILPIKKPTAAVTPVVSVIQDKSDANSTVSVNEVAPNPPVAAAAAISHPNQPIQQTPQFNINISLNTGQQAQQQPSPSSQLTQSQGPITDNRRPMAGGYFKFPVPFRHQRMCTSCLKHKPPVIDVEQGSSEAPITLDDSDGEEEKNIERSVCTSPHGSPMRSPHKALSTGGMQPLPVVVEPKPDSPQQVTLEEEGGSEPDEGAKRRKLDTNSKQFNNQTLYYAALKGDTAKVSYLLEGNPDRMNFRVKDTGMTPLHAAVKSGSVATLKELTRHIGAGTLTLEAMDKELQTPLFYAIKHNKSQCLRFLLTQGVNVNARDTNARTALHYACELGNLLCIDMLLTDNRIKVNTQDMDGWTALMWACEYKFVDVVKSLLEKGADPHLRDREQNIALHWAAFSGHADIVQLLLSVRSDIDAINERGDTSLHISARLSHSGSVRGIVNAGASLRLPNKQGKTCLQDASPEIVQLIQKLEKERDSRNFTSPKPQKNTVLHSDITCGKEKIPIPCINEMDDVAAPLDFVYVKESFESSYLCINRNMNVVKSCVCENHCRPGAPCSCFFLTTGGKCVYNKDGRLNTEISEQYNDIVIFECNQRCRCWVNQCRNRVIQKGLSNPLQLFRTNGKGWGVRSPKRLMKGSFICEYIGEIISDSDADRRLNDTYLFDLTVVSINSINNDNKTIGSIDACHYGNISRFINSSCEPNCVPVKVFVDHHDLRFPRIAFFTTKEVEPYEELTFYYGDSFWDIKKEVLKCCCGAPNCISLLAQKEVSGEPDSENSDIEIVE
ncbi:histone-lysine N-methyltransferase EHMT2-like isoform X2 [Bolinopsis microptera]|uniref:histone-lysine N-methyltransferase EHMT2-like isoform X2 n=1 Tax=Bolinopsis microptera TaxID=2820187 RepID=UPI00307A8C59